MGIMGFLAGKTANVIKIMYSEAISSVPTIVSLKPRRTLQLR